MIRIAVFDKKKLRQYRKLCVTANQMNCNIYFKLGFKVVADKFGIHFQFEVEISIVQLVALCAYKFSIISHEFSFITICK